MVIAMILNAMILNILRTAYTADCNQIFTSISEHQSSPRGRNPLSSWAVSPGNRSLCE